MPRWSANPSAAGDARCSARNTVSYQSAMSSYGAVVGTPALFRAAAAPARPVPRATGDGPIAIPYDPAMSRDPHEDAVAAAQQVLDDFMAAFNARDIAAFEATFNFPSIRLASNRLVTINPGDMHPGMLSTGALADWHHSAWERRDASTPDPTRCTSTRASRGTSPMDRCSAASTRST